MTLDSPPPIELRWSQGDTLVTWTYGPHKIIKRYPAAPHTVTAWPDPPSIIVVEAHSGQDPRTDNAAVLNPDGTERLRLRPPNVATEPYWHIGFDQVYTDPTGLVAVFATRVVDVWADPTYKQAN